MQMVNCCTDEVYVVVGRDKVWGELGKTAFAPAFLLLFCAVVVSAPIKASVVGIGYRDACVSLCLVEEICRSAWMFAMGRSKDVAMLRLLGGL